MLDIPAGFGTPDVKWAPADTDLAHEVAALELIHRALLVLRGRLPRLSMRSLAAELQVGKGVTERWLSTGRMSLDEFLMLAVHFGDSLLEVVPRSQEEMLPEAYDPYLAGWEPGTPLVLRQPTSAQHHWPNLAAFVAGWLDEQFREDAIGFLDLSDLLVPVMTGAVRAGCPKPALTKVADSPGAVDVLTQHERRIQVMYLPDSTVTPALAVDRIAQLFAGLSAGRKSWVAILVCGGIALQQLENRLHDVADLSPGLLDLTDVGLSAVPVVRAAHVSTAADLTVTVVVQDE